MKLLACLAFSFCLLSCQTDSSAMVEEPAGGSALLNSMCLLNPDEEVDPTTTVAYGEGEVGFCCQKCANHFAGLSAEEQAELVAKAR